MKFSHFILRLNNNNIRTAYSLYSLHLIVDIHTFRPAEPRAPQDRVTRNSTQTVDNTVLGENAAVEFKTLMLVRVKYLNSDKRI